MASPTGSLDAVLDLESRYQETGAAQARAAGAREGRADGRALGWASGAGVASELSFYAGVAAALAALPLPSPRAHRAVQELGDAARVRVEVCGNAQDVDFADVLERARVAFRAAAAAAGLPRLRFDAQRPSRMADLSF